MHILKFSDSKSNYQTMLFANLLDSDDKIIIILEIAQFKYGRRDPICSKQSKF